MAARKNIDWSLPEVMDLLLDDTVPLLVKAERLGVSYWMVSRKRSALGAGHFPYGGYGHISTNKERKARYNAKIRQNGYKPLKIHNNNGNTRRN